jgi:tetratricopeptide (TPR) repeat protein
MELVISRPLTAARRLQLAVALSAVGLLYILLAGKELIASILASSDNLSHLERAVMLSPGNADYHYRLARYFAFALGDPQPAIKNYRAAVELDPYDSRYWFDLAGAYEVIGDTEKQKTALDNALRADPTAPDVAWEAANFFLVNNDIDRALREFRVVIENNPYMVDDALRSCWRVRPDTEALLRDVVPPHADQLMSFIRLLISKKETDGTLIAWQHLTKSHEKFDNRSLYQYVNYLISVHRPDAAMAAWEESADLLGLSAYLPNDDNLVVNGDFSLDILNGGFDWTYVDRTGVRPLLDPSAFHQGHRSLSLTFEGPGINDAGISQLIPVRANTTYDFSAYYKSAEFEGAGGPEIVFRDAYTGSPVYSSNPLNDADFWKEVHSKITTSASTTLLVLAIERFPAGSPIRGRLWLDDFELSPATPDDSSASNSEDNP